MDKARGNVPLGSRDRPTSILAMGFAFMGVTYAKKINDKHSFGITPTLAAQRFKATGLQGFGNISTDSTKLTDNGYDYSYGYG